MSYVQVLSNGTFYYKDPEMTMPHREDGPAIEWVGGNKDWYSNGKLHREDGPAIEHVDGYRAWCIGGKYHRLDGPAVVYVYGYSCWYINGVEYKQDKFPSAVARWLNRKEITQEGIRNLIGNYRIVGWI